MLLGDTVYKKILVCYDCAMLPRIVFKFGNKECTLP